MLNTKSVIQLFRNSAAGIQGVRSFTIQILIFYENIKKHIKSKTELKTIFFNFGLEFYSSTIAQLLTFVYYHEHLILYNEIPNIFTFNILISY